MHDASPAVRLFVILCAIGAVGLIASMTQGCGGSAASVAARDTLAAIGRGVVVVETAVGEAQAEERERIRAERPVQSEARRRLSPFWRVGDAVFAVRALLLSAAAAIDAHGADGLREMAPCVIESVARLLEATEVLKELGAEIPIVGELASALRVLQPYAGTCVPEGAE